MENGGSGDEAAHDLTRPSPDSSEIGAEEFIRSAYAKGLITARVGQRLLAHLDELKARAAEPPESQVLDPGLTEARSSVVVMVGRVSAAAKRGEVSEAEAHKLNVSLSRAMESEHVAEIEARIDGVGRALMTATDAARSPIEPAAGVGTTAATQQESVVAQPSPPPEAATRPERIPEPQRRPPEHPAQRAPGTLAALRASLNDAWKTTTADFAANTLTYVGVLLAVVVIFVFFAFGYFGEVVREPNLRPPVFVAVPLFFLGVAWVLRTRTGLPVAASAIGMIGALTVPVMLSALFRDWAPFPPDLHGSDRYWGYALVGVISALIYFALATRQGVYAYLIPPILWAAAGSLGLYWRDGMSGPQLITVLATIVISLAAASRFRTGRIGGLLAVPTVRAAVVAAPFVFVMALVFAYEDAVRSGVETPGIEEMAQPGAMAAGLLALVLGLASSMEFAWQELGPRTRAGLRVSLRVLAYVAAGVAVMLALALEVTPGWIGVALVGYGIAVLAIDHLVKGTGDAALWIARGTILVGLVMAATEPVPALIVWSAALLVAAGRAVFPAVRTWTSPLLRSPADPVSWLAELWVPAFVIVGSVARLVDTPATPWVLLIAAAVMAVTRWLPRPVRAVRTYAEFPATTVALASLGLAVWVHLTVTPYTDGEAGVLALGFAGVISLVWVPWTWRAPLAVGSAIVGTALVIAGRFDPDPAATVMVETVVLIVPGVALMVASFVPLWRRWAYSNGLLGHLCLYGAVAAGVRTEDAAFVALAALVATHAAEAVSVERGTSPFIAEAAGLAGSGRSAVEFAPGAIAAVAAMPLAILAGRRVPWLREERARFSLVLGALAWAYAAAAAWLHRPGRWLFVLLAYLSTAGAVAVAFPSRPASLVAVAGAALVTFALAAILRRPGASTLSWILALVAVVLLAAQLGMDRPDLYRPLYASAAALVVGTGALNAVRGRGPGITARWLVPAVLVGLVGLPVSLSFSIAADSWTWMLAAGAAGAVAFLGWAAGAGGVTAAVAAYLGIAYADALSFKVNIFFDEPIYWMIFAAALVLVSGILPGRSGWRILHDASPGALLAGLASAVMALALAYGTDSEVAVIALSSLLMAVVWLLRRNDHWLHAAIAVLVWACAVAGGGWLPAGLAVSALIVTAMAELRRDRVGGVTYPWVAVVFWASAYAFFADWAIWDPQTVTVVTFCAGTILSAVAFSLWLSAWERPWIRRWLLPVATIGQVGLLGAVMYATAMLDWTDALMTLAVALGVEAALIGIYATLRTDPATAWVAAVLSGTAYGLYADALLTEPVDVLRVTGPIGAALLAGWAALAIINRPDRLVLWRWPALALAQAALAATAVVAIDALGSTAAFDVIAVVTAWEALLFALVATTTVTPGFALVSTIFSIGSYAALVHRFELDGTRYVLAWMALTLFGFVAATVTGRVRGRVRVGMWVWPLNAAAAATGSLTVMSAVAHLTQPDAGLVTAAVVAALGIHLLVNRPIFAPHVPVEMAAATAFAAAGALSVARLEPQTPWTFALLLAMSLVAAIAAPLAQRLDARAAVAAFILVAGYTVIPVVAAAAFWGPLSSEVGYLLIVTGGALAAYGVAARKLLAFEGAVVVWLCSMLILLNQRFGLELHATIVLVSVVLLAVLEVERYRHRRDGQPQPEALRVVEWIAMTVPLLLAASETFGSLAYALVLAAEGAALIVWAGLTRVRRRAVVGLIAVTTAIALGVMIPLFDEVRHGLSGGTWLIIGAASAVVMIAAGSVIERQRAQIGERLSRWGELLESWE